MPSDRPREDPTDIVVREFAVLERRLTAIVRVLQGADAAAVGSQAGLVSATGLQVPALLVDRLRQLRRVLEDLEQFEGRWAAANVTRQYKASAGAAQTTLRRAGLLARPEFQAFERRAAEALVERVASNLGTIRQGLLQGLVTADPRDAVALVRQGALEAAGVTIDGGVMRVLTPSGRFWRPTPYARMVARTGIADARRVAFRHRYLANGVDVVRVVANGTQHDVCAVWEGALLSLTGATPGLPTVDDARDAGLFHPNCTHRYVVEPEEDQPGPDSGLEAAALAEPAPSRAVLAVAESDPRTPPPSARVPRGSRVPGSRI